MGHDADASARIELEDASLAAGLDGVAARFEAVANQINSGFVAANGQLASTAGHAQRIGGAAAGVGAFSRGLALAAQSARLVATALSGVVTTAARIAPFVKYIPDSLGSWVKPAKAAAHEYGEALGKAAAKIGLATKGQSSSPAS